MQNQFPEWLAVTAIFLVITWVLATAAKWLITWRVDRVPLFQRAAASGHSVGASLGLIVSLFIWLGGLILVYQATLDISKNAPTKLQVLIIGFGLLAPKIVFAPICFFVGGMIAKIVRDIVATTLSTVDFDKWANLGGDASTSNSASSKTISTILFILLIVPLGIGALNVLDFPSFTGPVNNILQIILNVFFGAVLIGAGAILARVLKGLVATTGGEDVAPALVYWLTICLFAFVSIKQMNVGGQIVDYLFGAIAVGSAVAFVLAIGIRSREAIARKMNELFK
jgi:hypothetical protein